MTGLKGLELRDLLNISLWIRCAWSAGNKLLLKEITILEISRNTTQAVNCAYVIVDLS